MYQPPDRRALSEIWRALVRDDPRFRVLFVGVRPYTRALTRSPCRAQVVTIDPDPRMRFFGALAHRSVALEDLAATGEAPFDLAVVNGVFGWGIDSAEQAEGAIGALYTALRTGGILVLGINEERTQTPDLGRVRALERFRPIAPPPFGVHRHVVRTPVGGTHTFLFFRRP